MFDPTPPWGNYTTWMAPLLSELGEEDHKHGRGLLEVLIVPPHQPQIPQRHNQHPPDGYRHPGPPPYPIAQPARIHLLPKVRGHLQLQPPLRLYRGHLFNLSLHQHLCSQPAHGSLRHHRHQLFRHLLRPLLPCCQPRTDRHRHLHRPS